MGEKRQSRRLPYRKRIRLGKEEPKFMGYASNISDNGLEIESRNLYPPGTKLYISFQENIGDDDGSTEIIVQGLVKWSTRNIGSHSGNMGVQILQDAGGIINRLYRERINRLIK